MPLSKPDDLEQIPSVGSKIAQELRDLGIHSIKDLKGKDSEELYFNLSTRKGMHVDRCVLYVFRCAVYYASNQDYDPELLKWWNWKDV
ncbi:helix-hairpin-helix domain-containing protein [Methanococcoides sp. AM1]|uniref:helix-hairpin-helix domain-containing protein n=1 Tax=Methanococcoides sp. AM1 TaxID=1201011 RepID=UPI00108483CB|nr:helix-hairpin-helix domain-containing protein [Methanococcoides sp. AM1]